MIIKRIAKFATLLLAISIIMINIIDAQIKNPIVDKIFKLEDIKPGLKGKVYTVFEGSEPTACDAEVLGTLKGFLGPGRDIILVKLTGKEIENTNVFNGMSGSPLFIDNKLAGACAYRIGVFSKEVIVGATPAEYIVGLQKPFPENSQTKTSSYNSMLNYNIFKYARMNHPVLDEYIKEFRELYSLTPESSPQIGTPMYITGFNKISTERIKGIFGSYGFNIIEGASTQMIKNNPVLNRSEVKEAQEAWTLMTKSQKGKNPSSPLVPGSAISVPLITGDFEIASSGTLTYIDGNKIFAFGHPFYQLGAIEWPIYKAKVIKVYPSEYQSFHMVDLEEEKGVITEDGSVGIYGTTDKKAAMIPVEISVRNNGVLLDRYELNIVNDQTLTPILYWLTSEATMYNRLPIVRPSSIKVNAIIEFEGEYDTVVIKDIFAGSDMIPQATVLAPSAVWLLMNNEFEAVKIKRLRVSLDYYFKQRSADIISVRYDKDEVAPGESINLKIYLRTWRGNTIVKNTRLKIPKSFSEGLIKIVVGDSRYITKIESTTLGKKPRFRDLEHIIGILNSIKPSDTIYIQTMKISEGVYMEGRFLSDLPPSAMEVLTSKSTDEDMIPIRIALLSEDRISTDYFIQGNQEVIVKIKSRPRIEESEEK